MTIKELRNLSKKIAKWRKKQLRDLDTFEAKSRKANLKVK